MFKIFLILVFLCVVFGDPEEDGGLHSQSFRAGNVMRPGAGRNCKHNRRRSNIGLENGPDLLGLSAPNPVTKQDPLTLQLDNPGVNPAEVKDCMEKNVDTKMIPESQAPQRRSDVPDAYKGSVTENTVNDIINPETNKNSIQSDSLQLRADPAIMRQHANLLSQVTYPLTTKVLGLCDDEDDPYAELYKNNLSRRRSMELTAPINEGELEKLGVGNADDKSLLRSSEELEDPANRMGVSTYHRNKGNAISGSIRICYACSTLNNPTCTSPSKMTTVKYCSNERASCVTKTYEGQDGTILIRDCASACNESSLPIGLVPKYKTCSICHSDLCNSAFSINTENLIFILFISCATLCKVIF